MNASCGHIHHPDPPAPGATGEALARAEVRLAAETLRWTPVRRKIFERLVEAGRPIKAYDLVAAVNEGGTTTPPPTIYRVLDILVRLGLVHRVVGLSAYMACRHGEEKHGVAFLICDCCGSVEEVPFASARMEAAIAVKDRFVTNSVLVEAHGRCKPCRS